MAEGSTADNHSRFKSILNKACQFHLIGRLFILREYHLFIIQAYGASILLLYYMGILTHDIHAAILVVTTPEKFPTR